MRKLTLLSLLLLTACAGAHSRQVYNQLESNLKKEEMAWQTVWNLGKIKCPSGTDKKPLPRSKSIKRQDCYDKLINTHVMPVAFSKAQVMDYMTENRKISIDYKKGKIDRDVANLKLQENWSYYFKTVNSEADVIYQTAYKQDQKLARDQQQYLRNLSRELRQAETERYKTNQQALQNNKIRQTNCYASGNHVSCTSL